jgi:uncharacterized repeat protein (TIGR01451 family)
MKALCVLLLVAAVAVLADEKAGKPYLVVHKEVSEGAVTVGDEVKFTVTVTNHGESPAFDVQLVDKSPNGEEQTKAVEKLETQQSVSIEYTFKSSVLGDVLAPAAKVTYLEQQGSETRFTSYSNLINEHDRENFEHPSRGELHVVTATEYERLHTRYVKEILGYILAAVVPVLFPFYMYKSKQSQIEHLLRESKKSK